mmetsp:Transcript_432/g.1236  ORF Transcript_432/g.1236 Transcript_432/m.1236 type:complete len:260 (-) Transcript_432:1520-2299(-)
MPRARVLIIASAFVGGASALGAPRLKKRALDVRGGTEVSGVVRTGAALLGAQGVFCWMTPKRAMSTSGIETDDAVALGLLRASLGWHAGLAAMMVMDPETVVAKSNFIAAASLLAYFPLNEVVNAPKEPIVAWVAVCYVLGKLAHFGNVPAWVAPVLYLGNGLLVYFAPRKAAEMYGYPELTPLAITIYHLLGSVMLATAAYLGSLAAGLSASSAFQAAFVVIAIHCQRVIFFDAPSVGASDVPVFLWCATAAVLAFCA